MGYPYLANPSAARMLVAECAESPERELWATVLAMAIKDGMVGDWCGGSDQETDRADPLGSWEKCGCGGRCFAWVCYAAGVAPELVRERAAGERFYTRSAHSRR